jgi:hypothetical protein
MQTIEIHLRGDIAIVAEPKIINLNRVIHLVHKLNKVAPEINPFHDPLTLAIAQKIAAFLPRIDIDGTGFNFQEVACSVLEQIFIGNEAQILKLIYPPVQKQQADHIDSILPPIPQSQDVLANSLARMLSLDNTVSGAFLVANNLCNSTISALCDQLLMLRVPQDQRFSKYVQDLYERQIKKDDLSHIDIFGFGDLSDFERFD